MKLLEYCRNLAFWSIDVLHGRKVCKALDIIRKCDDGSWTLDQIREYQQKAVRKLLLHSQNTVPYYKKQSGVDLYTWPVVTKTTIKTNQEDFLSSQYRKEDLVVMSTSGSTGTPFRSYQDIGKKRHVNAEVIYYNGLAGYSVGKKIIYFRSIVEEVEKSKLTQFLQNITLLDCNDLSDYGISEKLRQIKQITRHGEALILSYASTLDAFKIYFQKHGYKEARECHIYGIVSGSEMLQDMTRSALKEAFHCKVVSRYANEENGFLGQDDKINNVFIPNQANYIFEILKFNSDDPANDGEVGRIVVTDLYNYAMPMIRYDTGDVGAWVDVEYSGRTVRALGKFGGRAVDMIFDFAGNQISPFAITNMMWKCQQLKQYQFIQTGQSSYIMRLNVEGNCFSEQSLLDDLQSIVGADAAISIEYTNEIPVLASGKRQYIVNQMKLRL